MKREIVVISLILLSILVIVGQFTTPVCGDPRIWTVDDDGVADFRRITDAVGNATSGDTIQVAAGVYYESNIIIDKALTLIGADCKTTIVDSNETSMIFKIAADHVTITGFTIRNSWHFYGVSVFMSSFSNISDNIIVNNWIGVWLYEANSSVIRNNIIINQYGIRLYTSCGNIIRGNAIISGYWAGIYLHNGSNNNYIVNNVISDYQFNGAELEDSNGNVIHHNNFINNGAQAFGSSLKANVWNSSAGRGNYWSDYKGVDDGSGGRVAGDGVGDTSLPHLGLDNYPLMAPWGDLNDDDMIDESDLNIAAIPFGAYLTQPEYNLRIDLNRDDVIDIFDIVIVAVNYERNIGT